jgi:hypothetical protein
MPRGGPGIAAVSPSPRSKRSGSSAASSKAAACAVPGRLPSTSAPSPGRARRLRVSRVGSRGARHRCRCSRAGGFRHRDPASGAASPAELPRVSGRASRLDPDLSIRTERRSSTSATNSNHEHDRGPPDPRPTCQGVTGVRLRAPPASPTGVPPPKDRTERRSRSLAGRPIPAPSTGGAIDPERGAEARRRRTDGTEAPSDGVESTATSRGFTGQGLDEPKLQSSVSHRRLSPPAARSRLPLRALRQ